MTTRFFKTNQAWPRSASAIVITMVILVTPMSRCLGDDPPPNEPPSSAAEDRASETLQLMATSESRLTNGQLDDETVALQGRIVDNLTAILQELRQRAEPAPVPAQSDPGAGTGSVQSSSGGDGGAGSGTDSEERPRTADDANVSAPEQRKNLASAAWGHLPPRVRERMYNSFSETYLPAYDDLVRDYYKALADESSRESP